MKIAEFVEGFNSVTDKDKYVYDVNMGYALFIALNNNGIKQRQLLFSLINYVKK